MSWRVDRLVTAGVASVFGREGYSDRSCSQMSLDLYFTAILLLCVLAPLLSCAARIDIIYIMSEYIYIYIHSLVFSLRGRAGRNQSPVM